MSLEIIIEDEKVLLSYFPEQAGPDGYFKLLKERGVIRVSNVFSVSESDFYKIDMDDIIFIIGVVEDGYYKIKADILGTERDYCFEEKIRLSKKDFVAARKTSILQMFDKLIGTNAKEVYIDKKCFSEADNHISYDDFRKFQKSIPHDAELLKYIWMRSATVFKGIFPEADRRIDIHEKWMGRIERNLPNNQAYESNVAELDYFHALDYKKLIEVRNRLDYFVKNCDAYNESTFQQAIAEIIRFIFPKYLYSVREVRFKGIDSNDKQPDFVLIDYNGMIDFLEIKKPSSKLINSIQYRNNFSPSRELSGTAQQIEKYIACINRCANDWEKDAPKKIKDMIPFDMEIKVINPQGLIIMGDARAFSTSQKRDFELIKRQYKNVSEIITYDDLLNRLDNMIEALRPYVNDVEIVT